MGALRRDQPGAGGGGADAARVARSRRSARSRGRCCARRSPTPSCWASSRASRTSRNPIVLAGNFEVLSTKIFFAVAGAQHDPGRAAVLAAVLLGFTLLAFWLQQRWLGRLSYMTVTGKGDGGAAGAAAARRCGSPASAWRGVWIVFTLVCYAIILVGGFVKDIGRGDMTLTLSHFASGFGDRMAQRGSGVRRLRVGQPVHDRAGRRGLGAAHRDRRAARRVRHHAPPVRRPPHVRVPDDGELRHSRHRDRRVLHRRVQRAAAGADRRDGDPRAVLRVPQHARRRARGHRRARADRQDAGRGVVDAARVDAAHAARGDRCRCCARRSWPRWYSASRTR